MRDDSSEKNGGNTFLQEPRVTAGGLGKLKFSSKNTENDHIHWQILLQIKYVSVSSIFISINMMYLHELSSCTQVGSWDKGR